MKPDDPTTPAQPLQAVQAQPHRPTPEVTRRTRRRPITASGDPGGDNPGQPRLRLTGAGAPDARPPVTNPTPIRSATDPRWVLAVRTADVLEGNVLSPDKREALMRTGKSMGLSAFDCSLIIAIVQDRARRGIAPAQCPAAGETQLALIPLPRMRPLFSAFTQNPVQAVVFAGGLLALQAMLIWMWLG